MNTLRAREGLPRLFVLYALMLTLCASIVLYLYSPGVFFTLCTAPGLNTFYANSEHDTPPGFMHSVFKMPIFPGQPVFFFVGLHKANYQTFRGVPSL